MSNAPEETPDFEGEGDELSEQPVSQAPIEDLSVFDDQQPQDYGYVSDDQALRGIKRRTTPFGKIVAVVIIGGIAIGGYLGYSMSKSYDTRFERFEALEARMGREDVPQTEIVAELRSILEAAEHDDVRIKAIQNLGHYRDAESVPILIRMLDIAGGVRREAAEALVKIGPPAADQAKDKLLAVLPDTSAQDEKWVLWALAVLREERAAEQILDGFQRGLFAQSEEFTFDASVIVAVLGPTRLSSDQLLNHDSQSVRVLTAHALAEGASAEMVEPLSKMLRFELRRPADGDNAQSSEVIRAVAAGLGRTGDARAARPLFELLEEKPNFRGHVIDALRQSTAAPAIVTLMNEASDVSIKRDLVRLVAESHDDRTADALAGLLGHADEDIKQTAAFALADLGDRRSAPVLLQLMRHEDDSVATRAIQSLRTIASPELSADLLRALDELPYHKADILMALAHTGDQNVASRIGQELEGDDARAASIALAILGNAPAYDTLHDRMERPSDVDMTATNAAERSLPNELLLSNRKAAIQAIGRYGQPDAVEALMTIVEDTHDDYELRQLAGEAIGRCATDEQMATVLTKIQDTALDEAARRYYLAALAQKPHPGINQQLLALIAGDAAEGVKYRSAIALGYSADPAIDARLIEMLSSDQTRTDAAVAIVLGGSAEAAQALLRVLTADPALGGDERARRRAATETRDVLQERIMNNENDYFNMLTESMVESGQIWRRMKVADILRVGARGASFGYAWGKVMDLLRGGWDGAGGLNPRQIREMLWQALNGEDVERRTLAAMALAEIPERGLMLRARDQGGEIGDLARQLLLIGRPEE